MNIYRVTRTSTDSFFDQYDSFICIAENTEQAKNLNPNFPNIFHNSFQQLKSDPNYHVEFYIPWNKLDSGYYERISWVDNREDLVVEKIGVSGIQNVGILLASFNRS